MKKKIGLLLFLFSINGLVFAHDSLILDFSIGGNDIVNLQTPSTLTSLSSDFIRKSNIAIGFGLTGNYLFDGHAGLRLQYNFTNTMDQIKSRWYQENFFATGTSSAYPELSQWNHEFLIGFSANRDMGPYFKVYGQALVGGVIRTSADIESLYFNLRMDATWTPIYDLGAGLQVWLIPEFMGFAVQYDFVRAFTDATRDMLVEYIDRNNKNEILDVTKRTLPSEKYQANRISLVFFSAW